MNQNEYHPRGMNGYGSQAGFNPESQYAQNRPAQNYYPSQNAQNPSSFEGYRAPAGQGYPAAGFQQPAGYTTPQVPYSQGISNGYVREQPAYQPYGGMPTNPNNPYAVPQGYPASPQGGGGSYIPQTPYSPGYTSPGYQPPQQGYQAGYNPYGQMGKTQAPSGTSEYSTGIPLNGGGYVPQKIPVRHRPFVLKNWHLIAMGIVLIILFVLAVIITKNTAVKILLMILAAGSAGVLWIKRLTAENKRLTYSVLCLVLCILTAASFLTGAPKDVTNNTQQNTAGVRQDTGSAQEIPPSEVSAVQQTSTEAPSATEAPNNNLTDRLVSFFTSWAKNRQDEMLLLCSPSWVNKQENPRTSLFTLLANRRPLNCTLESISGTDADNSRKVTLTSKIDRNAGREPELYRMTVLMVKENNEWYVDPQSLQSFEKEQTTDNTANATPSPTATPAIYPSTVLYYNPNKGEYYHYDAYCPNVGKKYVPLQGQFTYAQINDEPYSKLKPCNVCGAPLR